MKYIITLLSILLFSLSYGQVTFSTIPIDQQLVGRDLNTNLGHVIIEGEVDNSSVNYSSIKVEVYRNVGGGNILYDTEVYPLMYTSNIASFNFDIEIVAELANYSFNIYGDDGSLLTLEEEIADVVAGDVYIIQGQSNAVAQKRGSGSANGYVDNFIRVYASGTEYWWEIEDEANQKWFIGDGDVFQRVNGNTGQWGLKLANSIVTNTNIPVAIFNGAKGGEEITYFLADELDPYNQRISNYGRLYYRLNNTGLKDFVRAVLWSQGETDSGSGTSTTDYKNRFNTLKSSWLSDYPNIEHFYIFQTKNGCSHLIDNLMKVKEAQRQLAFKDPNISIMSTAAFTLYTDYCHFPFTNGYESFADRMFPLLRRDLYGWTTSNELNPPMITDAYLQDDTTLIVETDAIGLQISTVAEDFELSNAGTSTITGISIIDNNKIKFILSEDPGTMAEISYVAQAQDAVGNFITNTNGLELVCFNKYPISISSIANGNWNDPATWSGTTIPSPTNNVTINNTVTIAANANATINNLTIGAGSLTINSGGSLIVNGTSSGNITYNRNLGTSNWYLISSPFVGQDVDDFVTASVLQTGSGSNLGHGSYNTADDTWTYYQSGTSNAATFTDGQGYTVNLAGASGDISFTGTMNVDDESIDLITSGQGFNLLGNPYPSYINSGSVLSSSTGSLLTEAIWVWNQATSSYDTKVTVDAFKLAPGQGFFVQSNGAAGNVTINETFQSHQGTDTFLRSPTTRPEVYLTLSDGSNTRDCKLYYIDGTTTGFDNGYDGPIFGGISNSFAVYTHAVANGLGRNLAIQSLPDSDYENLIVPVGINATSGTEITISASSVNLPAEIDIYLEDKDTNTFRLLDAVSDFTTTLTNDLSGIGRFYLHTTSSALSLNDNSLAYNLQIYTTASPRELIVKGQLSDATTADLYDLQGRLILSSKLDQYSNKSTIDISSISTGIYVVKVDSGNQTKTQKVIIK